MRGLVLEDGRPPEEPVGLEEGQETAQTFVRLDEGPATTCEHLQERLQWGLASAWKGTSWRCCCWVFWSLFVLLGPAPVVIILFFSRHRAEKLTPEDFGISSSEWVSFKAADTVLGRPVQIAALWCPGTSQPSGCSDLSLSYRRASNLAATVIVTHGHGSCTLCDDGSLSVLSMAIQPLLCSGFNVLGVDQRNHGRSSDARPISLGYHEADDVLAAVQWLISSRNVSAHQIFFWGQSMGAATMAYAAARDSRIRAITLEAPPVSLGMVLQAWLSSNGVSFPQWLVNWLAYWVKIGYWDQPLNYDLLHEARFVQANVFHAHGYDDNVVPFDEARFLEYAFESRFKGLRNASYRAFFHPGGHVSSQQFPEIYYPMLLSFFGDAAERPNPGHAT